MPIDNYGAQYPGSPIYGQPPATAQANRTPITPGPVTAQANYANPTPPAPAIGAKVKVPNNLVVPPTALANLGSAAAVAAIATPARTPLSTPIGVSPHYKTPTEIWEYDYGNGGDGQGDGGP